MRPHGEGEQVGDSLSLCLLLDNFVKLQLPVLLPVYMNDDLLIRR